MKKSALKKINIVLGICVVLMLFLLVYVYGMTADTAVPQEDTVTSKETDAETDDQDTQDVQEDTEPSEKNVNAAITEEAEEDPDTSSEETIIPRDAVLSFAGDVMFSEQYLAAYDKNGVAALADSTMLSYMQESDLFILNEEFPFSLRGEPMEDKQYTFRTDPKYVKIFQELGVDLVTLANNHALDFGKDAFCDTLDALQQADIPYIGGGYNIEEASAPAVFTVNEQTFAVFGATRVSPSYDWYATNTQPGLFQTYDPAKLNAAVSKAAETYDHVIVFVHWGIERNDIPEDYQRTLAKGYIDAGADLIVGCHPHILQGFEYYNGVPIVYSLGNYLFGNGSVDTLLLKAVFSPDGALTLYLIPCKRTNGILTQIPEPSSLYQYLTNISFDVDISSDGIVIP